MKSTFERNVTEGQDLPFWVAAIVAVILMLVAAGCKRHGPQGQQMPPPPTVTVAKVEQRPIVDWEEFTGRTAPIDFVEVRPRTSGYISEVRFKAGQMVKKGDVLFIIDPRWAKADLDRRQAELAQARARQENAQREAGRTKQLLENKAISTEESEARQSRSREAEAALLAAEAALNTAKLDLELTEVRSPIDGQVSREMVTIGNYVSGLAGSSTLLTTVVSVDPIYVYADIDENSYLRLSELLRQGKLAKDKSGKTPVQVQLGDGNDFRNGGYIESFDNKVDPNTGSIVMRALFPNADGHILPGLFARLRLPASAEYPALLISEEAIGTDQNQKFVLTLNASNSVAEYRPVKLGPQHEGKRVIRQGLTPNDQVIVASGGMARVRPGMVVTPQPAAAPANDAKQQQASTH
jgi:multidrug efflux system membrane fusion protein